ncbi:MAG: hypothetical protein KGM49_01640 [Sphingomonadales bacterium]|nr:hypothetical protein [Sphingomonadales bacterium]
MLIRSELLGLRSDDSPQRRAQDGMADALAAWRASAHASAAEFELGRFADGTDLADLPLLAALFAPGDFADRFCADLIGTLLAQLDCEPLGQSPLRHYSDEVVTTVSLLRRGTTTLTLVAIDGTGLARQPAQQSVSFSPTETCEHVLAGSAVAERIVITLLQPNRAVLERHPVVVEAGVVMHRFGAGEALIYRTVPACLVILKLQRRAGPGDVVREYALNDGALLHQAAGSPRDSRLELSVALLGRMGRRDAAPMLAAMAEERGSTPLRWQVLRECLALDTAEGFAALCHIAARPDDPLRGPAGALRAQLVDTYPVLAGFPPCPG